LRNTGSCHHFQGQLWLCFGFLIFACTPASPVKSCRRHAVLLGMRMALGRHRIGAHEPPVTSCLPDRGTCFRLRPDETCRLRLTKPVLFRPETVRSLSGGPVRGALFVICWRAVKGDCTDTSPAPTPARRTLRVSSPHLDTKPWIPTPWTSPWASLGRVHPPHVSDHTFCPVRLLSSSSPACPPTTPKPRRLSPFSRLKGGRWAGREKE
jgi:hypothetical protein